MTRAIHKTEPASGHPRGIMLLLHGGPEHGDGREVAGDRGAFVQIEHVRRRIGHRAADAGISTWSLRNSEQGWNNEDDPPPVRDARWALAEARRLHPTATVVLVGHSMGGRVAIQAADEPNVVGVVGLSPWLPAQQSTDPLHGRHLAIAHTRLEHFEGCRPADVRRFQERSLRVAESVDVRDMGLDIHFMLFESRWHEFAFDSALRMINGNPS